MRNLVKIATAIAIFGAASVSAEGLRGTKAEIDDDHWARMVGVSWHADMPCPPRQELRMLTIPHWDFQGEVTKGRLIVHESVAEEVLDIYADLYDAGFRIELMAPVHLFLGDDGRSMAANNTSAFNCRFVGGTRRLSQHALGLAMDINPVQNPYVKGGYTSPMAGHAYNEPEERHDGVPGIALSGGAVVQAFKKRGWGWGGDWRSSRDYQHFSKSGN